MIVVETTARAEALERPVRALAANPPTRTAALLLNRYREIEASSLEAARRLDEHLAAAQHPDRHGPIAG
jgi:hypothetical protein